MPLQILYEDNHLLAVVKPPGLPTQGAAAGRPSLVNQAKEYLRQKYRKPGNVYLGVVSRLDSAVSGVVLFARTSKAAARLTAQFRNRQVEKIYWALIPGHISPPTAHCVDWLSKDERLQKMVIVPTAASANSGKPKRPAGSAKQSKLSGMAPSPKAKSAAKAQEARLSYRRVKSLPDASLLEIHLETGRKHQIRLQLAARGYPLLGDRKYGSHRTFPDGIALHCRKLVLEHPVKKNSLELVAPVPKSWNKFRV